MHSTDWDRSFFIGDRAHSLNLSVIGDADFGSSGDRGDASPLELPGRERRKLPWKARRMRDGVGGAVLVASELALSIVVWDVLAIDSRNGALKSSVKRGLRCRGCAGVSATEVSLRLVGLFLRREGSRATGGDMFDRWWMCAGCLMMTAVEVDDKGGMPGRMHIGEKEAENPF
jgi:hypothetical protein